MNGLWLFSYIAIKIKFYHNNLWLIYASTEPRSKTYWTAIAKPSEPYPSSIWWYDRAINNVITKSMDIITNYMNIIITRHAIVIWRHSKEWRKKVPRITNIINHSGIFLTQKQRLGIIQRYWISLFIRYIYTYLFI